jgi:hypothetical protein
MTDEYNCYICSDAENGGFCRIISIKNKAFFPGLVSWLSRAADPSVFTDYIEHFIFEDTLCIVMRYTQGVTLADKKDTEAMPLRERLELCRKILERAVLLDIPDYFLDKCMEPENIIVGSDLSVSFNYPIEDITGTRECAPMKKVEKLLRLMFAHEIERKVPDELIAFFGELPELVGSNMIELYSKYYMMMNRLIERDAGSEEPKSIWYRIWDKLKKTWGIIKRVVMFLLLAIAAAYLVFTINTTGNSAKQAKTFDRIGTVVIDKNR